MKALTLTQPWASLVAFGVKQFETRSWATRYRGPLAIHAARTWPKTARSFAMSNRFVLDAIRRELLDSQAKLPLGCVIAVCQLAHVQSTTGNAPSDIEASLGNWTVGRFAWRLERVFAIAPEPARGRQGLWDWESETDLSAFSSNVQRRLF